MEYRKHLASIIAHSIERTCNIKRASQELERLLEAPRSGDLGDLALPCFTFSKELKKPPQKIAEELAWALEAELQAGKAAYISRLQVVGPYINFFFDKSGIAAELIPSILRGEFLASDESGQGKVMVEYSQPNTHKAFHVGHIRCATLGDSLARLLRWCGHEVVPVNYIGDEGTHVAKCLWYYRKHFKGEVPSCNRGEFLGDLYTKATLMLDLSLYTKAPYPGVTAAKILSVKPHPRRKEWVVIQLQTARGQKTVVCGSNKDTHILPPQNKDTQIVAYARPGVRIATRSVQALDKEGVYSEGMICSFEELGLSEDPEIVLLPTTTAVGEEVAEIYRVPGALPEERPVLEVINEWQKEVGEVLSAMESKEPEITELWQKTKEWSMQEFYKIYAWLNCHFDRYFYESEFAEEGKRIAREFQAKGIFVESEGAVGADLNRDGLGFCILVKSDGTATYAIRDIALARRKFEEFGVDRSIYVVDSAQTFHFQQVFKCLELLGYEQAKKCHHLGYGQVVLPDGKMSSRKGNVILFSELKRRLLDRINREFLDKYKGGWREEEIEEAGRIIALATMRYGMLNQDNASNIVFDLDSWTEKSGNTGPYLLYAYARISSILRELGEVDLSAADYALLKHDTELELISHLLSYRDTLLSAANNYSPLFVCVFLYELAKKFSRMYSQCSVVNAENKAIKLARAGLVKSVARTLQHGLNLLGIPVLARM